jgi:nanoRNase/pAp phosphatase (c-di-AMP/oligoRNAs hydrolase)
VKEVEGVEFIGLVDAHDLDPDLADAKDIEILTIVDHHRATSPPKARFVDLRLDVGATATIFVEYLNALAPLDTDSEDDRRIATALMHGLSTDTDDFTLARALDFRAAAQISEILDRDLLQDLSRHLIAPSAMDVIARALATLVVRRNFAMAGVGFVPDGERDTIAQAADFLIRREDIDTVVVYGVVGDKFIEGSLRTHSASVDPAAWLEGAFGFDDKGRAFGGGRRDKGGFRIPIGFLGRSTDRAQLWSLVEHAARNALLRQLGEEPVTGVLTGPVT